MIEVCSISEGAWYDVLPSECSIVWLRGEPHIRIKFLFDLLLNYPRKNWLNRRGFEHELCEYFALQTMFEQRFRAPLLQVDNQCSPSLLHVLGALAQQMRAHSWKSAKKSSELRNRIQNKNGKASYAETPRLLLWTNRFDAVIVKIVSTQGSGFRNTKDR